MPTTSPQDRGASALQYVAVIVVVALIATGTAVTLARSSPQIRASVECTILTLLGQGEGCDPADVAEDIQQIPEDLFCDVATHGWDGSFNVDFRNIRAENSAEDELILQTNPTTGEERAEYSTRGSTQLGVAAGNSPIDEGVPIGAEELGQSLNGEVSWEAFAVGGVGLTSNYEFTGPDAHERAEQTRDLVRGDTWQRVLYTVSGTTGEATSGVIHQGQRWVHKGWEWAFGDNDQAAVDAQYQELVPDSVTIDLNADAGASAEATVGLEAEDELGVSLGAGAEVSGTYSNAVTIDRDFNRTHEVTFGVDGNLQAGTGLDMSNVLPVELQGQIEAGGGAEVAQRTEFDSEGNPVSAEFDLIYEYGYGVEAGVEIELDDDIEFLDDDDTLDLSVSGGEGTRVAQTVSLDLTDPDNLAAYEGVFNVDTGVAAVPNPMALAEPERLTDLQTQVATNSEQLRFEYAVDPGEEYSDVDGSLGQTGSAGLGWSSEESSAYLTSAEYRDNSVPGAEWLDVDC